MRLFVLFVLACSLLLLGCVSTEQQASPTLLPQYQPGEQVYQVVNEDGSGQNLVVSPSDGSEYEEQAQASAEPYRRKLTFSPIVDVLEFKGKLYFLTTSNSGLNAVYEYVDQKTPPKISMSLRYLMGAESNVESEGTTFNTNSPAFKGKLIELNSIAVHGERLYAGGRVGLFAMKPDGSWEHLNYPISGAIPQTDYAILTMKEVNGELYAAMSYLQAAEGYPDGRVTTRLVKFNGEGWVESPQYEGYGDFGFHSASDIEFFDNAFFVASDSGYYKLPVTEAAKEEDYAELDLSRSNYIGIDAGVLYECGEGGKLFKLPSAGGKWEKIREFRGEFPYCLFFKKVGGTLYFGVQGRAQNSEGEIGLFKIEGGEAKQVATIPLNRSTDWGGDFSGGASAIQEYNGEIFVGGKIGDGWGRLYKLKGGKLEELVFYKEA